MICKKHMHHQQCLGSNVSGILSTHSVSAAWDWCCSLSVSGSSHEMRAGMWAIPSKTECLKQILNQRDMGLCIFSIKFLYIKDITSSSAIEPELKSQDIFSNSILLYSFL